MTAGRNKLTREETIGIAALGRIAKTLPKGPLFMDLATVESSVAQGEVVVVMMSAAGALVGRAELKGYPPDADALRAMLVGADIAAERHGRHPRLPRAPLPEAEAALLDASGFMDGGGEADPLERAHISLELLLRESLTVDAAARALSVSTGRLRQRLALEARTLYGIKIEGRAWRIPRFQFATKRRLVRHIDQVLPRVRGDAHPLSVQAWFTTSHQDLVTGPNERPVTPVAWLEAGLDPSVVADLAAEI